MSPDPAGARRFAVALVGLALAALAIRVAFTLTVDPEVPEVGDAMAYHHLANHLADGEGYVRPFDLLLFDEVRPTAEYPPLFPAVISVASLVGVDTVTGHRVAACLIGAAAVAMIGLLGRRVTGSAVVGLVAAGLAAVYPMLFLMDATLMPEGLFTLLVAATLLAAY
ncbi:MAG: glycosyltransferase family 39 protein, partial [Actinomycetota bacterium]